MSIIEDFLKNSAIPTFGRIINEASASLTNVLKNNGIVNQPTQNITTLSKGRFSPQTNNVQQDATATDAAKALGQSTISVAQPVVEKLGETEVFPFITLNTAVDLFGRAYSGVQRVASTALLQAFPGYSGQLGKSWKDAANIPVSQPLATLLTQPARNLLGSAEAILNPEQTEKFEQSIEKYAPFLSPRFDLSDNTKRIEAYENNWTGAVFTGGLSLYQMWAEGLGVGKLAQYTRLKTGVEQNVFDSIDDLKIQSTEGKDWFNSLSTVPDANVSTPPNGISVLFNDIVQQSSPVKILENPLVKMLPPEVQAKTASIYADAKSWDEVESIFFATTGDRAAFDKLWDIKASAADAINDFNYYDFKNFAYPFSPLNVFDEDIASKINRVVDDIAKNDPELAKITQDWAIDLGSQAVGTTNWVPSRYASIEQARLSLGNIRNQRLFNEAEQAGTNKSTIKGTTVQKNIYTRPIHVLNNTLGEKPRGYIDYSDPRGIADARNEIIAEINDVKWLNTSEYSDFKESLVKRYLRAGNSTERQKVMEQIDQEIVATIGSRYNLTPEQSMDIYNTLKTKQSQAQGQIAVNGNLPLEDGSVLLPDPITRSQMASSHIMLPYGILDRAFAKQFGTAAQKERFLSKSFRYGTEGFDWLNSIFSFSVLVKPGYIPKNSILEPQLRILAVGDTLNQLEQAIPAIKNTAINVLNRSVELPGDIVSNSIRKQSPKSIKNSIKEFDLSVRNNKRIIAEEETNIRYIDINLNKLEVERIRSVQNGMEDLKIVDEIADLKNQKEFAAVKLEESKKLVDDLTQRAEEQRQKLVKIVSYRASLKEKKSILEEDATWEINGKTFTVPGPLSTKAKGGLALRAELDPANAVYQQAIQSGWATRYSALRKQTEVVKIKPGEPDYWREFAHEVNVRAKNDEIVKMWASGVSRQDAMDWLGGQKNIPIVTSKNGKVSTEFIGKQSGTNYINQVTQRLTGTEYEFGNWYSNYVNDIYNKYDAYIPDVDLRQDAIIRNITPDELEARYMNRTDLPAVDGKRVIYPGRKIDTVGAIVNNLTKGGYRFIQKPEFIISKNPFLLRRWNESIDRQVRQAMALGVDVTNELINDRFRFVANSEVVRSVEDTFYTVRRQNNVNYYSRFLMGFPTALINSYKFWAKAILKNPYNAVVQYKLQNLPYESGLVVDQDGKEVKRDTPKKEGEQRFLIIGMPAWADTQNLEPFTKKIGLNQWNSLSLGVPGASWLIQQSVSNLVSNWPTWEKSLKNVLGENIYSNVLYSGRPIAGKNAFEKFLNSFVPSWLDSTGTLAKQTVKSLAKDDLDFPFVGYLFGYIVEPDVKDEQAFVDRYNLLFNTAMVNWVANGSPEDSQPKEKAIRKQAYDSIVDDVVNKVFAPFGVIKQPITQFIKDQTRELTGYYEQGVLPNKPGKNAYQSAQEDMSILYSPDISRLMSSSYSKEAYVDSSIESYSVYNSNKKFLNTIADKLGPEYIGMIVNPDVPGEYSPAVSSWMQGVKLGTGTNAQTLAGSKKSIYENQADFERRNGWQERLRVKAKYDALLAQSGAKSYAKRPDLKAKLDGETLNIAEKYPAFKFDYLNPDINNADSALTALTLTIFNEDVMKFKENSRKWDVVVGYMFEREDYVKRIQDANGNKNLIKQIKGEWEEVKQDWINSDTFFADMHARWLDNDNMTKGFAWFLAGEK